MGEAHFIHIPTRRPSVLGNGFGKAVVRSPGRASATFWVLWETTISAQKTCVTRNGTRLIPCWPSMISTGNNREENGWLRMQDGRSSPSAFLFHFISEAKILVRKIMSQGICTTV